MYVCVWMCVRARTHAHTSTHYILHTIFLHTIFPSYVRSYLAYYSKGEVVVVSHPAYTLRNYIQTNLLFDLAATVPYELITLMTGAVIFCRYILDTKISLVFSYQHFYHTTSIYHMSIKKNGLMKCLYAIYILYIYENIVIIREYLYV